MSISFSQKEWSTRELVYADDLNRMDECIASCVEKVNAISTASAECHNNIFRGKDLTNLYTVSELHEMINTGTFDDIYIGDYYDMSISSTYTAGESEEVRWLFAGFDLFYYYGNSPLTSHHAVMVPLNCFITTASIEDEEELAEDEDLYKNGFVNSQMFTTVLPAYASAVKNSFGSDYVLSHDVLLTSEIDSDIVSLCSGSSSGYRYGASVACEWVNTTLNLMNEVMVNGYRLCSSSHYDNTYSCQFPLFYLAPYYKCAGYNGISMNFDNSIYYTSSYSYGTRYVTINSYGRPHYLDFDIECGVRPYFLLG